MFAKGFDLMGIKRHHSEVKRYELELSVELRLVNNYHAHRKL